MNIERLIKQISKAIFSLIFNKEQGKHEKVDIKNMTSLDILPLTLKHLIRQGKYSEAEDVLFREAERSPGKNLSSVAEDFYNILLSKSDEELLEHNFPRQEIYNGLSDIKAIVETRVAEYK